MLVLMLGSFEGQALQWSKQPSSEDYSDYKKTRSGKSYGGNYKGEHNQGMKEENVHHSYSLWDAGKRVWNSAGSLLSSGANSITTLFTNSKELFKKILSKITPKTTDHEINHIVNVEVQKIAYNMKRELIEQRARLQEAERNEEGPQLRPYRERDAKKDQEKPGFFSQFF